MKAIPWPLTGRSKIGAGGALITTFCAAMVAGSAAYAGEGAQKFPEGISPSDVYESVDLLSRSAVVLLEANKIKMPPPRPSLETGLGPFHVYQIQLACIERLHKYQRQIGMRPIPLVTSVPMKYVPADVKKLSDMMIQEVRKVASRANVEGLPEKVHEVVGKTPTDVASVSFEVFSKLNLLGGQEKISPNEAYAQVNRAVGDAESILKQVDPPCRYLVDAPASEPGRTPTDVVSKCFDLRRAINKLRQDLGLGTTPVPTLPANQKMKPIDVFVQTQIIIAELNLLKMKLDTASSTPLAIPVHGKTPTDVHQRVAFLEYLIPQVQTLQNLVAQADGN